MRGCQAATVHMRRLCVHVLHPSNLSTPLGSICLCVSATRTHASISQLPLVEETPNLRPPNAAAPRRRASLEGSESCHDNDAACLHLPEGGLSFAHPLHRSGPSLLNNTRGTVLKAREVPFSLHRGRSYYIWGGGKRNMAQTHATYAQANWARCYCPHLDISMQNSRQLTAPDTR